MIEFTPAALGGISVICFAFVAFMLAKSWFAQSLDQFSSLKQKERRLQPRTAEQAERYHITLKAQLEEATGCTITKLVFGGRNGWKWVHIDFTWKWNGYVTKSAFAKAACNDRDPPWELKMRAITKMTKEMGLNKLDWWY